MTHTLLLIWDCNDAVHISNWNIVLPCCMNRNFNICVDALGVYCHGLRTSSQRRSMWHPSKCLRNSWEEGRPRRCWGLKDVKSLIIICQSHRSPTGKCISDIAGWRLDRRKRTHWMQLSMIIPPTRNVKTLSNLKL
jgi:hypothetical protein